LGGGALGASLGAMGSAVSRWLGMTESERLLALGGSVILGLTLDLTGWNYRLPGPRRQVNERWLDRYRGWAYGVGFGFQLGLGVVTIVTTAMVYVVTVAVFVSPTPLAGLAIGATFGALRGLTVLPGSTVREPSLLYVVSGHLRDWKARVVHLCAACESAIGVLAVLVVLKQG